MKVLSFDMGTRNLAFALVEAPQTIIKLGVIDLQKHSARTATDLLMNTLAEDNKWMLECCDEVVVESQPSSGACKTLSIALQIYFRLYDEFRGNPVRPFRFMHAKKKFDLFPDIYERMDPQHYDARKETARQMALRILQENEQKYMDFFQRQPYKRQTDVADALVQACQHITDQSLSKKKRKSPIQSL